MNEDSAAQENPLIAEWTGPYGGVPAFDRMDLAYLKPALETGMALHLAEIDAIANDSEPPTFENTIVAMERSGEDLSRAFTYYGLWSGNLSSPEFREIQAELVPELSDYRSKITQNAALFARIRAVFENEETKQRSARERRLVWLIYNGFAKKDRDSKMLGQFAGDGQRAQNVSGTRCALAAIHQRVF